MKGYRVGEQRRWVRGHYRRLMGTKGYQEATRKLLGGRRIQTHRLRAERALGKPLPLHAVVHHADGSLRPDAPLVICPDEAYHKLLHRRMRIKALGGDPNTDAVCCYCHQVKPHDAFNGDVTRASGLYGACRECDRARRRVRYQCRP